MKDENKLVPKLRFPEFSDKSNWKEFQLNEISEHIKTKVGSLKLQTVSITAGYGYVTQVEKFGRDISGEQYKNYIVLKKGEYAYNKGNSKRFPQGCIYKLKEFEIVAAPNAFICFRFNDNYVGDFFQGYFDNNYHGKQLQKFITSGARSDGLLNISVNDFLSIKFPSPNKAEQQKIADCLSSIGDLISAQARKVAELKARKKGLMQQLFPAEGESVPILRFKEFEGEWEEKKLGEISDLITKGTTPAKFTDRGIRFIKIEAFDENQINAEKCAFITEDIHNKELKRSILRENDILFAIAGATIGKVNIVTKHLLPANTNQALAIIRLKEQEDKIFILNILKSETMKKYIKKCVSVGAQPNLNLEQIGNFSFYCTSNRLEQQKIASFLSSIDERISAEEERLSALKLHKKGLLQQLFPHTTER
jgi:type I restriction enzyme, S subunit